MRELIDTTYKVISWILGFIIYVGPVYITFIFIIKDRLGSDVKSKLGLNSDTNDDSVFLKIRRNPLFSLLVLSIFIWFYYQNLDSRYLNKLLFFFSLPLVPLFLNTHNSKYSINNFLYIILLFISLFFQYSLNKDIGYKHQEIAKLKSQISTLNRIIENKNIVISSIGSLNNKDLNITELDSLWKTINTNDDLKSYEPLVKSNLYSRLVDDALDFIDKKQFGSAIDYLNYIVINGFATSEVYFLLGNSYLEIGEKVEAIRSYRTSSSLGNEKASQMYEKLNPLKKRIAYYVTLCCDGTYSNSTGRGTCSWHGGVCQWNYPIYETYRDY